MALRHIASRSPGMVKPKVDAGTSSGCNPFAAALCLDTELLEFAVECGPADAEPAGDFAHLSAIMCDRETDQLFLDRRQAAHLSGGIKPQRLDRLGEGMSRHQQARRHRPSAAAKRGDQCVIRQRRRHQFLADPHRCPRQEPVSAGTRRRSACRHRPARPPAASRFPAAGYCPASRRQPAVPAQSALTAVMLRFVCSLARARKCSTRSGMSSRRMRSAGTWIGGKTCRR